MRALSLVPSLCAAACSSSRVGSRRASVAPVVFQSPSPSRVRRRISIAFARDKTIVATARTNATPPCNESASPYYAEGASGPTDVDSLLELYLAKAPRGDDEAPRESSDAAVSDAHITDAPTGKVYLVGTGPGDPGLLTLKAFHLMQTADVVLYDRLVSPAILDLVHPQAHMLYVGKQAGFHTRTQDEIEKMLVGFAGRGLTVVRLKGGDPLVFGRGGEEMETLMQKGYGVKIVPGVTAAAGVGSKLGIPLTHRGSATSVRLLTGHLREGAAAEAASGKGNTVVDPVDFAVTSADKDTTLVVYMGLQTLPTLSRKLIENGFPRDMPAVAVERGTTPFERRVFSDVAHLPDAVLHEGLKSPTLIIVGNTVKLSPLWPWRNVLGEPVSPPDDTKKKHVLQEGPVDADSETNQWFERTGEIVRRLRLLGNLEAENAVVADQAGEPVTRGIKV
jgi:uroporphyrin-III C-methyltransferase